MRTIVLAAAMFLIASPAQAHDIRLGNTIPVGGGRYCDSYVSLQAVLEELDRHGSAAAGKLFTATPGCGTLGDDERAVVVDEFQLEAGSRKVRVLELLRYTGGYVLVLPVEDVRIIARL